jgi:subtilisin
MPIIDPNVQGLIESVGYSSVVVLRKSTPPSAEVNAYRVSQAPQKEVQTIPNVFLKELPDTAGISRVKKLAEQRGIPLPAALAALGMEVRPAMPVPEPLSLDRLGMECGFLDATGLGVLAGHESVEAIVSQGSLPFELISPGSRKSVPAPKTRMTECLERLRVDVLRDQHLTGKGIGVAHLDTGVDPDHPSLKGRVAKYMETKMDGGPAHGPLTVRDSSWHGTATAALICGGIAGKREIGVAPNANLYSCVVIEGGDTRLRVLAGINWALTNMGRVRVLCMALGVPDIDPEKPDDHRIVIMKQIISACKNAGILPVVAIGNDGPGKCRAPGNFSNVLSVGAVDRDDRVLDESSSASYIREENPYVPSVVAPGDEGVITAKAGGGYITTRGTSFAAALVSGVAALLFEAKPDATPAKVTEAIKLSAKRLRETSPLRFGYGLIDARGALDLLEAS